MSIIQTLKILNSGNFLSKIRASLKKPVESVFFTKLLRGCKNECDAIYKLPGVVNVKDKIIPSILKPLKGYFMLHYIV